MKRVTITHAVLIELVIVGAVIWSAFAMHGCATFSAIAPTAEELAVLECKHWATQHPEAHLELSTCDDAGALFGDIVRLVDAKPSPQAVKEALIAHPPLSSAAALAMPCLAPPHAPIDEANPYREPQSRIERRLYPFVVEPPARGE